MERHVDILWNKEKLIEKSNGIKRNEEKDWLFLWTIGMVRKQEI